MKVDCAIIKFILSPDLSDEDIDGVIERCVQSTKEPSAYKYYYDDNNCILF